jgi:hypothetical protein
MAERALATAFVNVIPGTKTFEDDLKRGVSGSVDSAGRSAGSRFGRSFGGAFRNIAGPFLAAAGATSLVNFLGDSIQAASDLNEQATAVGQVFGNASKEIDAFANSGAKALGQSRTQILEAAKTFGIYGKSAGLTGKQNVEFSKSFVKLATDMASFNNTSTQEAIDALGAGLRGEAEPLRRFGVLLDDATLRQAAFGAGIVKTTKDSLTPQQRVLAAQIVIMKQTTTQQGDFARTSDGLANQQRILAAEFENVKSTLGASFLPIAQQVVSLLADKFVPALEDFFKRFKEGKTALNPIVDTLTKFFQFVLKHSDLFTKIGAGILAVVAALKLWSIIQGTLNALLFIFDALLFANPITLIAGAIAGVIAALALFFTQTDIGRKIWGGFIKVLTGGWSIFKTVFVNTIGFIGTMFRGLVNLLIGAFERFLNFVISGVNLLVKGLNLILRGIKISTFGKINLQVSQLPQVKIPRLATGGLVTSPTLALIGEAGPELVIPASKLKQLQLGGKGPTYIINYTAAPNQSLDSETALVDAITRARLVAGW